MIQEPTISQATETYKRTVKDELDRGAWPTWCVAVSNSLAAGVWLGGDKFPAFAKSVYEAVKEENNISYADSR